MFLRPSDGRTFREVVREIARDEQENGEQSSSAHD
jgi:hypothetical protein